MPRTKRVEYEGAYYHVMARGNRRSEIVVDDRDRERFVETLGEVVEQTGWEVYAWALMNNHYHLLIRTPEANLVKGMTWFQNTLTKRFNGRHKLVGHLFAGRYKALLVEEGTYLRTLVHYINLNPVRAKILDMDLPEVIRYRWSSLREYVLPPSRRHEFSCVKEGLGFFSLKDTKAGREEFWEKSLRVAGEEEEDYLSKVRSGWVLGSAEFLAAVSKRLNFTEGDRANGYGGAQLRGHSEATAEEIVSEGLARYEISEEQLGGLRKNDWRKAKIALEVRMKTTMNGDWIAKRLQMGSRSSVTKAIEKYRKEAEGEAPNT